MCLILTRNLKTLLLVISLLINLFIAIPSLILFSFSSGIQYEVYENILNRRLGAPQIVFLGDSITKAGKFNLCGGMNFNVWNFAENGFTTNHVKPKANLVIRYPHTQRVFIMMGINDVDKSEKGVETSFNNYKEVIDSILSSRKELVVQLTLYSQNESDETFVTALNKMLVDYGEERGFKTLDLNGKLAPNKYLLDKFTTDGLHLNRAAYKVWHQELLKNNLLEISDERGN